MKKAKRHWYKFNYHWEVEALCKPRESTHMHDKLHILMAQTVANYTGGTVELRDCKTGRFKGNVPPKKVKS